MDLLRLDTVEYGPVYVSAGAQFLLGKDGDDTNCGVVFSGGVTKDMTLAGDPDEVAQSIERCYPGCRIYRVV